MCCKKKGYLQAPGIEQWCQDKRGGDRFQGQDGVRRGLRQESEGLAGPGRPVKGWWGHPQLQQLCQEPSCCSSRLRQELTT